jgi:hypothetical protein
MVSGAWDVKVIGNTFGCRGKIYKQNFQQESRAGQRLAGDVLVRDRYAPTARTGNSSSCC